MKKVVCTCDICKQECKRFYTLNLPRKCYTTVRGGCNNHIVGAIPCGVKTIKTDVCENCYFKLSEFFPSEFFPKEEEN